MEKLELRLGWPEEGHELERRTVDSDRRELKELVTEDRLDGTDPRFEFSPRLREELQVEVSRGDEEFEEKVRLDEKRELNSLGKEDVDCPDSDRRLWVRRWLRLLTDEEDRLWKGVLPDRFEVNSLIRREEIVLRLLASPPWSKVDRRREVVTPRPLKERVEEDRLWKGMLPDRFEVNSLTRREEIVLRLLAFPPWSKVDRRREVTAPRSPEERLEKDERGRLPSAGEPLNRPLLPNARPE